MRCGEVQPLRDPYLDSELDAKTTVEIERHLSACPDCARQFAEEEKLEARIKAGLNQGARTAGLWEQIERAAVGAAPATTRPRPSPRYFTRWVGRVLRCAPRPVRLGVSVRNPEQPGGWLGVFRALEEQVRAAWRRSPGAWAGLAVAWVVILGLNFTAGEPGIPLMARQQAPSALDMRLALKQKEMLIKEL